MTFGINIRFLIPTAVDGKRACETFCSLSMSKTVLVLQPLLRFWYSKYLLLLECLEYKHSVLAGIPYISCIISSPRMDFPGVGTKDQYAWKGKQHEHFYKLKKYAVKWIVLFPAFSYFPSDCLCCWTFLHHCHFVFVCSVINYLCFLCLKQVVHLMIETD